jgi:hypothetical protein
MTISMNAEDYILKRNIMYEHIKETINQWVVIDTFEYEHMSWQGLTARQRINIDSTLENELKNITNNNFNDWCSQTSQTIILCIQAFLKGLVNINKINNFTSEEYAKLIYDIIVYYIDDETGPQLLEEVIVISK